MEEFRWRTRARLVACVNLTVLTVFVFMTVIIKDTTDYKDSFVSQVINSKESESKDDKDSDGKSSNVIMLVALFVFSVIILLLVLGFCAAVKLIKSTDKDRDPQEALALAEFWQIVNLIYILLGCLEFVQFRSFWYFSIQLILLGSSFFFWFVVSQFMDELKQAIAVIKSMKVVAEEGEVDASGGAKDSMI